MESPWEVPKRRGGTRRGPLLKKRVLDAQNEQGERSVILLEWHMFIVER